MTKVYSKSDYFKFRVKLIKASYCRYLVGDPPECKIKVNTV